MLPLKVVTPLYTVAKISFSALLKTGGTFTSNAPDNVAARPEPFVSLIA